MNVPRSSIVRWMISISLIALAFALIRTGGSDELRLGEFACILATGLMTSSLALVASGWFRRYFIVVLSSSVVTGLLFWVAPISFRSDVLYRVILPIDDRFGPVVDDRLGHLRTGLESEYRLTRTPFLSRTSQLALGLCELVISICVSLLLFFIPSPFGLYWKYLRRS